MSKKLISLLLTIVLLSTSVFSCYASGDNSSDILTEVFVRQEIFRQYSLIYDTFSAAITLEDGTEVTGLGFTDYSTYYEAEDGSSGFFPAGFIADYGYTIPREEAEKGLEIENLDFTDDNCMFVYDYETKPFMDHCVKDGQYLKYGVNEQGAIVYETSPYKRGVCDETLGALFSYDTGKYVFDPDMGNYTRCFFPGTLDSAKELFPDLEEYYGAYISKTNSVGFTIEESKIVSALVGRKDYYVQETEPKKTSKTKKDNKVWKLFHGGKL